MPSGSTFRSAEAVANATAATYPGGPWQPDLGVAFVLEAPAVANASFSALFANLAFADCATVPFPGLANVTLPAARSNLTNGDSPDWILLYSAASGAGLLVLVRNGSGQLVDRLENCGTLLSLTEGLPGNTIDSSTALAAMMSKGGYSFAAAHPGGNLSAFVLGATGTGAFQQAGLWAVTYSTCPLTGPSPHVSYYRFMDEVGLTDPTQVATPGAGATNCSQNFGIGPASL